MEQACPFCSPEARRVIGANGLALALRDAYPVSPGHALIVPRRHVASAADATPDEFAAIWSLLSDARTAIDRELKPDGGKASISGNSVTGCGYGLSPLSNGIGIRGTREPIVIERNDIESGPAAPSSSLRSKCGIAVASANATIRANRLTGRAASYGVFLATAVLPEATVRATNVSLFDNRMSDLVAESAQLFIAGACDSNRSANNQYGSVADQGLAGIAVQGNENHLINEQFVGTYGSSAIPLPCVWLRAGSSGNRVEALKYRTAPQGMDLCGRVRDDGTNIVPGYERCKFL